MVGISQPMVHITYTGYLVNYNLQTSLQKHKSLPRLISTFTKSFVLYLITCYNLLTTTQQRFDSRGVLDIQYCSIFFIHTSLSLITVAHVHSTLQPCSSNQCNTAHLESKLIRRSNHVQLTPWDWTLVFRQGSTPRIPTTASLYETTTPQYEEYSRLLSGTLLYSHSPLILLTLSQLSKLIILVPLTFVATTAHIWINTQYALKYVNMH
jgi:hypothetical protein